MPAVTHPAHKKGDLFVDYEEKVFEDVKAKPGEKALVTFHTVAFEGSIGLVNLLQATRLAAQGLRDLDPALRPRRDARRAARLPEDRRRGVSRHQNFNNQITKFINEGGKVYACRFALAGALRPRRAFADRGHPADQPARRARSRAAAPARQRLHPRHLDALSPPGGAVRRPRESRMSKQTKVRAAAVQIAPDLTSGAATLQRVLEAIAEASGKGAEIIVFPETFVPWYPYFSFVLAPVQSGAEHIRLYEHAIAAPGPETDLVAAAARKAGVVVVLGINERDHGSLYNTQLVFDADGALQTEAAQDHADFPRAHDLGPGRRLRADGGRHRSRPRRRARLLGALQSARALRADGAARGNPRCAVSGFAGRPDLRRADRGDDPPPRAGERLFRRQRDGLAHRGADRLDYAERGACNAACAAAA